MKIVIIGGGGFIGINAAYHFAQANHEVILIDNLSRIGSDYNIDKFQEYRKIPFFKADIRNYQQIKEILAQVSNIDAVLLLAGQVAVTTSVINPREDFEINAMGTFNVLEALRTNNQFPLLIYSSTNKVYGKMENVNVVMRNGRYEYETHTKGINENQLLDFYSPYGCSKGTGDQYVRDYSRIYNFSSIVLRQSCIYGIRQFGIEDQGWLAWFTIASILDRPITIFGDGNQIRDVLFVNDLCNCYESILIHRTTTKGQIYNIGGGPENTLSLNELVRILEFKLNKKLKIKNDDWRPGDQKVFVSDISKISSDTGWKPTIQVEEGIDKMISWIYDNLDILKHYVYNKV